MNKFCLFTFLLGTLWVSAQTELTDEQKWELWKLSYMNLDSARGALKTIDSTSAFYSDLSQHIQFESGIVPSQIKSNSTSSNTLLRGSFFVYHDEFDSA
ncbi:MAG: hypothetical protein MRY83_19485, partial [Flavobacteriales bacterium]|nr:hypothetical protein [Flavobacteriales bacterium]